MVKDVYHVGYEVFRELSTVEVVILVHYYPYDVAYQQDLMKESHRHFRVRGEVKDLLRVVI